MIKISHICNECDSTFKVEIITESQVPYYNLKVDTISLESKGLSIMGNPGQCRKCLLTKLQEYNLMKKP